MAGTLFVVATPIGNLEDLTFRALRTLREVQLIAAEDTRRTAKLLAHYDIRCRMVSLREHNEARETPRLIAGLDAGEDIALVSDAGTPGIADPGARFVRAAHDHGVRVVPIPGPSAIAAALSASGLPADQFTFLGFPPSSGRAREEWFEAFAAESRTIVFFESPHRINRTLAELRQLVDRPIYAWREITKIHENLAINPIDALPETGEFTIVVGPSRTQRSLSPADSAEVGALIGHMTDLLSIDTKRAVELAARAYNITPTMARRAAKRLRYPQRDTDARHQP